MACLGVRCSNKDFCYIILEGDKKVPKIVKKGHVPFPQGYSRSQSLKWFLQEIEGILKQDTTIKIIAIKGSEGMASRGKSFVERVENEAIILLAAANLGIRNVLKKVKCTIAKDLGTKGKSRYLSNLNYSVFPEYERENEKMKEAILVAWSSLP